VKKIYCFFLLMLIGSISVSAQKLFARTPVRLDPAKDKVEYKGYTIHLVPTIDGYYGFDISKEQKIIVHQVENPIRGRELSKREDAFKVAKWLIELHAQTGHLPAVVPPGVLQLNPSSSN
jgi:hypothetical protein